MIVKEEKEIYTDLGQRISNARKELNITQEQLAKIVGLTQPTLASYEIGRRKIPIPIFLEISEALRMDLDSFFPYLERRKRGPVSKVDLELEKVKALPLKQQKIIMDMIESVIRNTP
ncbi:MAG: helix-turn-helix transcriptional regulator [Spirochaetaceae bacterium]|nr:helix-turn-helix transcriptional regulator [Spirochaetaceae bacterium]